MPLCRRMRTGGVVFETQPLVGSLQVSRRNAADIPWPRPIFVATALMLVACQAGPQPVVVTPRPAAAAATNPTGAPLADSAALSPPAAPPQPTAAAQVQPSCAFGQGFATMRDLVGAATVGDCREMSGIFRATATRSSVRPMARLFIARSTAACYSRMIVGRGSMDLTASSTDPTTSDFPGKATAR